MPEAASSLLLPQRIGHAKAAELFLLGLLRHDALLVGLQAAHGVHHVFGEVVRQGAGQATVLKANWQRA